jgi:GNAT superfamily N-acetyltransferase
MKLEEPILRPAEPNDAVAVAGVHVRSWQVAYRGLLPDGYLDGLRPEERAQRYTFDRVDAQQPETLVALLHGEIRGFATLRPVPDPDVASVGELCGLYVDPSWWGKGIGTSLLAAVRARLVERGFSVAILWVLIGNTRARKIYSMDGWVCDGSSRVEEVWGVMANEVRYRRILRAP